MFSILADMGLYTIAVREMSTGKHTLEKVLGNMITIRMILSVAAMTLALGYAYIFG